MQNEMISAFTAVLRSSLLMLQEVGSQTDLNIEFYCLPITGRTDRLLNGIDTQIFIRLSAV